MFEVDSSIALSAPVGRVWRVLSDFNHYREWHPFISLTGAGAFESILTLEHKTRIRSLPPISAQARVIRYVPNASVAWQMRVGRLIAAEEGFELVKIDQRTEVRHHMRCGGIVSVLGIGMVQRRMRDALAATNKCLSSFLARGTTITRYAPLQNRPGKRNAK
ncbi:SRPBCC domain-containing protein [Sphingomonas sp. A2-49]|jgi:hypothetical protein|uniref:SRPBCC domain-containing protein n=1 Tax=Sphingomonas sp. A2-49 TaxID=1391375 RepID=UPI0021D10FA4|nr:SRPBCC domain-containing protein [Sphingomonas sp. A2-49]MCU6453375.1 SRPBCC domain-containing protein [Sphingomonas sp. A2-49]